MTTAATSLLGLALPVTGELSGTWGDTVNDAITSLLDTAVAGTTTLSADSDVTLTTTTLASNQARQAILLWTASGTVTRNITAPAQSKVYIVVNKTGGTQSIVLRGAGPTTGITIIAGEKCAAAWDGTDFVKIGSSVGVSSFTAGTTGLTPSTATTGAVTLAGTLITSNGGTGLTSFTAGDLPYYSSGTALSKLGIGTNGYVLTSSGTAPQWTALSGVAVTTISGGTTGLTPSSATAGAVTLAGTLNVANGGTGATSLTANNVILGNGTSAVQVVAPGTSGNVLTSNGTTWSSSPSTGISTGKSIAMAMIFGG